jgi:Alpha galactosidase A/Alpha galactosidase C-terminal beta sandwich domain/NPCBM-associated, NEW3 domain of alpha-galactosidase
MRRLIRGLTAVLIAAPLIAIAVVSGAPAANALDNGLASTPPLGWSSWSFIRRTPTADKIKAQADAMKSSGLADVGYRYVNLDDFWYQCPGSQGPNVDGYGRWVTDPAAFPPSGSIDGVQVVADYVHSKGLKFGLYVTPGISHQAVVLNTPIEGTPYHAADIATTTTERNYNCHGMVGIDYTKPGAQEFINSWADQYASWGIDYLKIDGVGTFDVPDIAAWSAALRQTGRPIHLELSNNLSITGAATWRQYANGWRTSGDVECYCGPGPNGSGFPLTDWSHVQSRFNQVANWQPYGGPGGFNDYDSIEVGNGAGNGLTPDERKTQMSLWAMGASPFILGTDLTNLDPLDLSYLKNTDVLAVDQDAIDASRIVNTGTQQVFTKTEPNGDVIVALFNTTTQPEVISTTATALGLPAGTDYLLRDLWTHQATETAGAISPNVPPHGVALYRVSPDDNPALAPPHTTLALAGPTTVTAGQPVTFTVSFTDNGDLPAKKVALGLHAPATWSVTATSPTSFSAAETGQTVQTTFQAVVPQATRLFETAALTATASYTWSGKTPLNESVTATATVNMPVQPPYLTFASTTASFAQLGTRLGIRGDGGDVYGGTNQYGTIYLPASETDGTVATVEVLSQDNTNAWAKAGIMVRNDITNANSSPGFLILAVAPGHGYVVQWDANGDGRLESNSAPAGEGLGTASYPSWLKLVRSGTTFTGYYSTDDTTWITIATVSVPSAAATQDVGIFMTSHSSGTIGEVDFDQFAVTR